MKGKELLRRLKSYGVTITKGRGKGGHVRASYGATWTIIPTHGDKDMDPHFIKRLCKQLNIDPTGIV